MITPSVTIACVGAGYWGKNLVRVFHGLPEARLKLVCDLDQGIRKAIGQQYPDVRIVAGFEPRLEDHAPEAAGPAVPTAPPSQAAPPAAHSGKTAAEA